MNSLPVVSPWNAYSFHPTSLFRHIDSLQFQLHRKIYLPFSLSLYLSIYLYLSISLFLSHHMHMHTHIRCVYDVVCMCGLTYEHTGEHSQQPFQEFSLEKEKKKDTRENYRKEKVHQLIIALTLYTCICIYIFFLPFFSFLSFSFFSFPFSLLLLFVQVYIYIYTG